MAVGVKEIVLSISFFFGGITMYRLKHILSAFLFVSVSFLAAHAQPEQSQNSEQSYDVSVQLLIGSNDAAGKADVPSYLAPIARQLRSSFSFSDYRLSNTFVGRIASGGSFEYKSVAGISGREAEPESQSFLEWSLVNLSQAADGVQSRGFRIGARVPVRAGADSGGRAIYNYEAIGLNLSRIGMAVNRPTLIGTLSLPRTDGTIFVVMTIRPAEL